MQDRSATADSTPGPTPETAAPAVEDRRPGPVEILLLLGTLLGLIAGHLAVERHRESEPTWWDGPGYLALEQAARGIDRAVFLSDGIDRSTNTRLHSTQYAIIPGVLDTEFDWAVVFGRLDAGEFLICDFASPARLDVEIGRFRDWATREKRDVIAERIGPNIAVLRAGERP